MKKQRLMIESIRYITGNQPSLKIQGPTKYVKAYKAAVRASRNLYENLQQGDITLEEIEKSVQKKNRAALEFRNLTGTNWPF